MFGYALLIYCRGSVVIQDPIQTVAFIHAEGHRHGKGACLGSCQVHALTLIFSFCLPHWVSWLGFWLHCWICNEPESGLI